MLVRIVSSLCLLLSVLRSTAQPGTVSNNIKIDQFGYYPSARKVAVISKPQSGFNLATEGAYSPGTGSNAFQLRRWSDNGLVFSGTLTAWNGGATHDQSGDKGWWFDFSPVTTPDTYYIYDVTNNVRSYPFAIGSDVYNNALKQALRVFFYQRINFAKAVPYADSRWADGAAFEGASQDRAARSLSNTNPKDLHGGWMDAGDYNKYTTFASEALMPLLEAYRRHPSVFGDNNGIPESGNGVSDLLDEVKWEIEWMKRMQDASGTRGLYLKVGVTGWNSATPASSDNNARFYLGECTSATICGASVFALSSIVYRSLGGSWTVYADTLLQRSKDAWTRASAVTSGFTTNFGIACDDQTIKAGDGDATESAQNNMAFVAAVYLYEATGSAAYKTYIDANYSNTYPFTAGYWGPYYPAVHKALLRYAALPTTEPSPGAAFATAAVATAIRNNKGAQDGALSINAYNNGTDLYRSFMPSSDYAWGSNRTKCYAALNNYDSYYFSINAASAANYKETGEAYVHYLHGVNALGMMMLTNMYNYGGDKCANQMSHAWFRDGSNWDDAQSVLPVDLLRFVATAGAQGADLQWEVSETDNLLHFVVERSMDGARFFPIATVNGVSGRLRYSFHDEAVKGATAAWYRIWAVEVARVAFSPIRRLGANASTEWRLTPNPVQSFVILEGRLDAAAEISFEIRNSAAAVIERQTMKHNAGLLQKRLDWNNLSAGIYWLRIETAGSSAVLPFVKQ